MARERVDILKRCIGPHEYFCSGFVGIGHISYITAPVLAIGISESFGIEKISDAEKTCSFDAAEVKGTYIGQINSITVSSFCGPQGFIWGLDIAKVPSAEQIHHLLSDDVKIDGSDVCLYNADPLLDATRSLFGTVDRRRFPFYPGSHVMTALKTHYAEGPAVLYAMLAIGIPKDRGSSACLFMEDVGTVTKEKDTIISDERKTRLLLHIARSALRVAKQQRVELESIFVAIRVEVVPEDSIGCAMASIPYFHLARRAVPQSEEQALARLSLEEWESVVKESFLFQG